MGEEQSTWKDKAEQYSWLRKEWTAGRIKTTEAVSRICKETIVPALEAGLSAIVPLVEREKAAEHMREILGVSFKNISQSKPAIKESIKKIISLLSKQRPEAVVEIGITGLKDRNPKIVAETLKVFADESKVLSVPLLKHILPQTQTLFSHKNGQVREEATRLYQTLAEKDPEAVGEATKELKPIQIKEIFQPKRQTQEIEPEISTPINTGHSAKETACLEKPSNTTANTHIETQVNTGTRQSNTHRLSNNTSQRTVSNSSGSTSINTSNKFNANNQNRTGTKETKDNNKAQKKQTKPKIEISLPKNFLQQFNSSQWKDRLVIEELNDQLGETKTLSVSDSIDLVEAITKRPNESNNKVFIASMSVLRKIFLNKHLREQEIPPILSAISKRLKDKKDTVYQAVMAVFIEGFFSYRGAVLDKTISLLKTEVSSRPRTLKILLEIIKQIEGTETDRPYLLDNLIECTKDSSPDSRSLACNCIARLLSRAGTVSNQEEIEGLGIDKILAKKIEVELESLAQIKEEEVSALVDSLCEDIKNTSITQININASGTNTPVTPIKQLVPSQITNAIVTDREMNENVFIDEHIIVPMGKQEDTSKEQKTVKGRGQEHPYHPQKETYSMQTNTLEQFVKDGILTESTLENLLLEIGHSQQSDYRIVFVLCASMLPENHLQDILDKISQISEPNDPHVKLSLEGLKARINRVLGEKTLFQERCIFAGLIERLNNSEPVPEAQIIEILTLLIKRSVILKEEEARVILKTVVEKEYWNVLERLETIFPFSKTLQICTEMAQEDQKALNLILLLIERFRILPNTPMDASLTTPEFISLLEEYNTFTTKKILSIIKNNPMPLQTTPNIKRIRQVDIEEIDINSLLNDIIDENKIKSKSSLQRLDLATETNLNQFINSASTLVNVLLLQLNDSLSSGALQITVETIVGILKRVSESERFLSALDSGTLLSFVSDYIVIITGSLPKGTLASESIRKECGETLIKMCVSGPCSTMFKIYMILLSTRYREEKTREILVKLIWKHSKVAMGFLGDKKTVNSMVQSLNSFYTGFRRNPKIDALISKVLQLHLIEILKYYGEDFLRTFKVSGPVLQQVQQISTILKPQ
ncbi:hypothetical protein NEOKW01_1925 [Nematocida sp. AWRm80]|nr:hypothetical protein NEOKW01_1925 [Nematocida sp. AWRm80]